VRHKRTGSFPRTFPVRIVYQNNTIIRKIRFREPQAFELLIIAVISVVKVNANLTSVDCLEVVPIVHLMKEMIFGPVLLESLPEVHPWPAPLGKIVYANTSLVRVLSHADEQAEAVPNSDVYERAVVWHLRHCAIDNGTYGDC
jgi:hypothetical protein